MSSLPGALQRAVRNSMASCWGCFWPEESSEKRSGSSSPLGESVVSIDCTLLSNISST